MLALAPQAPNAEAPPARADDAPAKPDWSRLKPVGVLAAVATVLPPLGGFALLGTMAWVGPWLGERPAVGVPLFVTGFIVLAGLALLPTYAQAVLAGFAFGIPLGVPAALTGFTGAAALGYLVARRAAGDRLAEAVDANPRYAALHHVLLQGHAARVTFVVALLRLPPNSPFALSNVALAGLAVPKLPFVLGTLIGMTPRTVVAVVIGSGLADFDLSDPGNSTTFAIGIGVTVAVVVVLGVMARRVLDRMAGPQSDTDTATQEPPGETTQALESSP